MSCLSSHINGEDLHDLSSRFDGHDPCGYGVKVAMQERALDGHDPCGYVIAATNKKARIDKMRAFSYFCHIHRVNYASA
jgi:hypothetical protein